METHCLLKPIAFNRTPRDLQEGIWDKNVLNFKFGYDEFTIHIRRCLENPGIRKMVQGLKIFPSKVLRDEFKMDWLFLLLPVIQVATPFPVIWGDRPTGGGVLRCAPLVRGNNHEASGRRTK